MEKFIKTKLIHLSLDKIRKLKLFGENREIRESHAKKLYDSIKETKMVTGTIVLAYTNVFNENPKDTRPHYYIVDGQHRTHAIILLAEEGIDISETVNFEVLPEDMTKDSILRYVSNVNSLSKKFVAAEYLELYKSKNEAYEMAIKLNDTYKNVKCEYILLSMYPNISRKELDGYRSGNLPTEGINPSAVKTLDIISDLVTELRSKNIAEKGLRTFIILLANKLMENPEMNITKVMKRKIISAYKKSSTNFTSLKSEESIRDIQIGALNRIGL